MKHSSSCQGMNLEPLGPLLPVLQKYAHFGDVFMLSNMEFDLFSLTLQLMIIFKCPSMMYIFLWDSL